MANKDLQLAIDRLSWSMLFCTLLALKTSGPLDDTSWWWICLPLYAPPLIYGTIAAFKKPRREAEDEN